MPQPDGPISAVIAAGRHGQRDPVEHLVLAEPGGDVDRAQLREPGRGARRARRPEVRRGAGRCRGDGVAFIAVSRSEVRCGAGPGGAGGCARPGRRVVRLLVFGFGFARALILTVVSLPDGVGVTGPRDRELVLAGLELLLQGDGDLAVARVPVPTTFLPSLMVTVPVALDDEPFRVTVTVPLAFLPNLTVFGKRR